MSLRKNTELPVLLMSVINGSRRLHPLLQDQWGHVEEIRLVNDGSGLGFGIVGGKTTGVVVRTLIPHSVADKVRWTQLTRFKSDFNSFYTQVQHKCLKAAETESALSLT